MDNEAPSNVQPQLDVFFVNTFVECTLKVIGAQTNQLPVAGKPVAQNAPILMDRFGMIRIRSSHFSGIVLLSFSEEVLNELFVSIFNYAPNKIQQETEGFLSEIMGLIHETARTELQNKGYAFYPSSASIVGKANLNEYLSGKQIFLNVPVNFKDKTFQVCVGIEAI